MNCLLIMPAPLHYQNIGPQEAFSLGIGYISAAMKRIEGITVHTANCNQVTTDRKVWLTKLLEDHAIDVILSGGVYLLYESIRDIFLTAKTVNPAIVTIVGGGVVSGDPLAAMEALEYADYGVIGEGEISVTELCAALRDKQSTAEIPGLVLREEGGYRLTEPRREVADLDTLPWCDYDGFNFRDYLAQDVGFNQHAYGSIGATPSLYMLTSRSCTHQCTFCFHPEGKTYRCRSLRDIFAEFDHLYHKFHPQQVYFCDEMIGMKDDHLKEFCSRISCYDIPWITNFRVNDITVERVRMLKQANCRQIILGLESASDAILRSMRKGTTIARIENALAIAAEERVLTYGGFIFGDPEETHATAMETLEWYLAHPGYLISLHAILYFPGTPIYWRAVKAGVIKDRAQYMRDNSMQLNFSRMSDAEYNDIMYKKIPEYEGLRYNRLPRIRQATVAYDLGKAHITGLCSSCGGDMDYDRLYPISTYAPLVCRHCMTLHATDILRQHNHARANVRYLLDTYGKVAFWGIGRLFKNSLVPETVADPAIRLVDMRHGGLFGDKPIEDPEVIGREAIPFIITPTRIFSDYGYNPAAEIEKAASRMGATHFLDFSELCARDLTKTPGIIRNSHGNA